MPWLTGSAFRDLAVWMVGLGLLIGLAFPPFTLLLGMPAASVIALPFAAACVAAGLLVCGVNFWLARFVVGSRVRILSSRMETVRDALRAATYSGDWSGCNPEACVIPVDSTDELGESARSFNELISALGRSHRVETAIREFSATLSAHLEIEAVCRHALRDLLDMTGVEGGALLVNNSETVTVGASIGIREPARLAESEPVLAALHAVSIVRLEIPEQVMVDAAVALFPAQSVLLVPVSFKGAPVGVLVLAATRPIEDDAARLIEPVRPLLAVGLNNALTHEQIQRLATLDPLTGLYNRRSGFARLREEYQRSIRSGQPLAVAIFDIDHFKAINDAHGHVVGDRVLVRAVAAVRRTLREADVLVRYGGEEFLVLLPGSSLEDAGRIGERIRCAVKEALTPIGDRALSVTISMGVAGMPAHAVDHEEDLVKLADGALYSAKAAGRDHLALA